MIQEHIDNYIQDPSWLSDGHICISNNDYIAHPWLGDKRLGISQEKLYKISKSQKIIFDDLLGEYNLQGIAHSNNDIINTLLIIDNFGNIVDNLIFSDAHNNLYGEVVSSAIQNREQSTILELVKNFELVNCNENINILLDFIKTLKIEVFTKKISKKNFDLIKFLFDFGHSEFRTNDNLDLKKIDYVLKRLNNQWNEPEIRTILQMVNSCENIDDIFEAEMILRKIGGVCNVSLIIYKGRYNRQLIDVVRQYELSQKELLSVVMQVKEAIKEIEY